MKDEIGCVHFNFCSGCVVNSCKNPPALFEHAKLYFKNKWQVDLGYIQGNIRGWRTRAKLAVRPPMILDSAVQDAKAMQGLESELLLMGGEHSQKVKAPPIKSNSGTRDCVDLASSTAESRMTIGLFEKGTHNVVAIPECQVHHPKINEAISRLEQAIREAGLTAYNEKTHKGDLRYVQCVVERQTGKVQLSLVLNMQRVTPEWQRLIKTVYNPDFWHSIWCNYNTKPLNTIFGKAWERIAGQDVVWEHLAGLEVAFGPSHFGQANLELYEKLIFDIQKHIRPNSVVAELYSGIGTIGLCLAEKSKEVRLCEVEPHAEQFFNMAKARLPAPLQNKLSYLVGRTEDCLNLLQGAGTCVVDPPRKGLGHDLIDKILSSQGLQQIAYVSCEWQSLERDLDYIQTHFKEWKVVHGASYLFFPGTNQLETLVILELL